MKIKEDLVFKGLRIVDLVVIILIIIIPIAFFAYNLLPQDLEIIETKYINLTAGYYETINAAVWQLSLKCLSISLFCLWFVTCRHWWRYFILISISFELFKLFSIYNEMFNIKSTKLLVNILFVIIPILLILLLSFKLKYFSFKKSLSDEVNSEIDNLLVDLSRFKSKNHKTFKNRFIEIRDNKTQYSDKQYLKLLLELREEFTMQNY